MPEDVLAVVSSVLEVRPSRSQLEEGRDRDAVLAALNDAFGGTRVPTRLPAPQPVSLDGRALLKLQRERAEYLCTLKADGERYVLVMLMIDEAPVAVMVSRRLDCYEIPVAGQLRHFSPDGAGTAMAGTVLDGELVALEDGMRYLVFDAIVIDGQHLRDCELTVRMENVYRHFEVYNLPTNATTDEVEAIAQEQDKVVPRALDCRLKITAKRWWTVDQVGRMWDGRGQLGCGVDGIVFARRYGIVPGTDRQMFKWKSSHTVDVCLGPDGPLLAVAGKICPAAEALGAHTAKIRKRSRASVTDPQMSVENNQLVEVLTQNAAVVSAVVECEMTLAGNNHIHLRPVKERPDKTIPNDVAVVYGAISAARESIGLTRLAEACAGGASKRKR
jgi:hypothetical protein